MTERSPMELMLAHQQRIDEMNGDGAGEPRSALDYLQDVYRGRRQAEPQRMRAAALAIPFETPKLAVVTNLSNENFAVMLDKAIARSRVPQLEIRRSRTMADDRKPTLRLVSSRAKSWEFDSLEYRRGEIPRRRYRQRALALWRRARSTPRPHTLPSGINYALKLPLASGTGERLSLVFESVFRCRSAPR